MAIDTTNFIPDTNPEMSIRDWGIPILFKINDKLGNPYNLTNVSTIEIYFRNLDNENASEVVGICQKADSNNGFCFYVKKQNDVITIGRTKTYPVVYTPATSDFPEGQRISGLRLSPEFITFTD